MQTSENAEMLLQNIISFLDHMTTADILFLMQISRERLLHRASGSSFNI